jgi:hypothetical protein
MCGGLCTGIMCAEGVGGKGYDSEYAEAWGRGVRNKLCPIQQDMKKSSSKKTS